MLFNTTPRWESITTHSLQRTMVGRGRAAEGAWRCRTARGRLPGRRGPACRPVVALRGQQGSHLGSGGADGCCGGRGQPEGGRAGAGGGRRIVLPGRELARWCRGVWRVGQLLAVGCCCLFALPARPPGWLGQGQRREVQAGSTERLLLGCWQQGRGGASGAAVQFQLGGCLLTFAQRGQQLGCRSLSRRRLYR